MKKRLMVKVWTVIGTALMVLGGAASARADQEVVARVPFDFIAGGVRLPAGKYFVAQQGQTSLISIESADRRHFAFVLMNPMLLDRAGSHSKLVFERVGPEHFLSQIVGDGKEGLELPLKPADMERELERLTLASAR
jgi:hypothetical protein